MRVYENAAQTPESLADVETGILRDVMADGLRRFEEALQSMADAEPSVGSDGRRLRRARRIGMEVDASFGKARIGVVCGQSKSARGWETPFRDRLFRGERGAVSPALERKAVTTVCETGSFEKAAKVCGVWEGARWSRSALRTRTASSGAASSGQREASRRSLKHTSGTRTTKSSTITVPLHDRSGWTRVNYADAPKTGSAAEARLTSQTENCYTTITRKHRPGRVQFQALRWLMAGGRLIKEVRR